MDTSDTPPILVVDKDVINTRKKAGRPKGSKNKIVKPTKGAKVSTQLDYYVNKEIHDHLYENAPLQNNIIDIIQKQYEDNFKKNADAKELMKYELGNATQLVESIPDNVKRKKAENLDKLKQRLKKNIANREEILKARGKGLETQTLVKTIKDINPNTKLIKTTNTGKIDLRIFGNNITPEKSTLISKQYKKNSKKFEKERRQNLESDKYTPEYRKKLYTTAYSLTNEPQTKQGTEVYVYNKILKSGLFY